MAFDPAFSQFAWAPEAIPGVPADTRVDVDFATAAIIDTPATFERTEILPGGEAPEDLPAGRTPTFAVNVPNLHPDTIFWPFGWIIGAVSDGSEMIAASDHWLHTFSIQETDNRISPYFTGYMFKDDGHGIRALGSIISQISGSFAQGTALGMDITALQERVDYWGDAVRTGTGTAKVFVRGIGLENFASVPFLVDAASDLDLKVTSGDADELVGQVRQGAEAYGPDQTLIRGQWNWIHRGALSTFLGDRADKIEVYVTTTGTIVAADVYHLPRRRATPVKSTPDPAGVVVAVYSEMKVDDILFPVTTGQWTISKTGAAQETDFGAGRQPVRTVPRGFLRGEVTLTRRYKDVEMVKRIEKNTPFAWRLDMYTRDTSWDPANLEADRVSIECPRLIATGSTVAVTGPNEMTETVTARAAPGTGGEPAITVEIVNTQETLGFLPPA